MNLSVLIHTFDAYKHLWPGFVAAFEKHWSFKGEFLRWGSDFPCDEGKIFPFKPLYSGPGEWSDRLRRLLTQIDTPYVLYIQEDMWLTASPPDLGLLMYEMRKKDLLRLQIAPINHFYTLFSEENTIYFDVKSKYLVSHQPSIWKKSFLLDCLKPGESPWMNEYKGTLRLQQTTQIREFITKKIAIYPYDWFTHKCVKGVVQGME